MALSNIFREPRRELTESAVGIVIGGGLVFADWSFGSWLASQWPHAGLGDRILGMMTGAVICVVFVGFLFATHALGETICNALARRGLELRPKVRPGQKAPVALQGRVVMPQFFTGVGAGGYAEIFGGYAKQAATPRDPPIGGTK